VIWQAVNPGSMNTIVFVFLNNVVKLGMVATGTAKNRHALDNFAIGQAQHPA
jgi:hypothetical protein